MKKTYKYLIIILICFCIIPLKTKAECSYERQAELSRIAANVKTSYNYELVEEGPHFYIDFVNVPNDIYIVEDVFNSTITRDATKSFGPYYGTALSYTIYSNDNNCKGEEIITRYLSLPAYNPFSQRQECEKNPDFKYCQIWINTSSLNETDFEKAFKQYNQNVKEKQNKIETQNTLLVFLKTNQKIIITVIFLTVIIVILIILKRRM